MKITQVTISVPIAREFPSACRVLDLIKASGILTKEEGGQAVLARGSHLELTTTLERAQEILKDLDEHPHLQ